MKDLTFDDVNDIITDEDYSPILNDMRWVQIKYKMFLTALKKFDCKNEIGENIITTNPNDTAFARELGNNTNSAFTRLNAEAYYFLNKKNYNKAYQLFKISINTFPPNIILNQNMGDYYLAVGDKDRAYVYYSRAEVIKYKQLSNISNHLLNYDSVISSVYNNVSKKIGSKVFPPEYLVSTVANAILKKE